MSVLPHCTVSSLGQEGALSYAGWRVVAAMFLVTATVFGATLYGFIILSPAVAAEHEWTATQSGSLVSAMWLTAPLALVCAPIIRRVGAWRLVVAGLVLEALAFCALAFADAFWQVYLLRVAMGAAMIFSTVTMPVIVAGWFSRQFGVAMAIAWCGGAFGGLALSPTAEFLSGDFGWKSAVLALAALMLLTAAIVALIGWGANAARPRQGASSDVSPSSQHRAGIMESLRQIRLATAGTMSVAVAASGVAVMAFAIQASPLLTAIGFSPSVAATVLGLSAAGGMAGNLAAGWALDHFKVHWTSLGIAALITTGLAIFHSLGTRPITFLAVVAGLMLGAGMGACEILWITLTKRQFGTGLFALTYGGWSLSYQFGYALSGSVAGTIYDRVRHEDFLLVIGCLCLPAVIFSLWRPGRRNEEEVSSPAR